VTVAEIATKLGFSSRTVAVVMVEGAMASLKVTVGAAVIGTFVVPPAGVTPMTVGPVVSVVGALLTLTLMGEAVVWFPAASRARAVSV
jgi:hypothetical protein